MISILMPVRNAAPFLAVCLDSIRQQTETEWELIAVDDFSTDDSLDILGQYARDDQRFQIFQNSERGIIPAMRLAFANSSGSLITRMDADDLMPLQKLEKLKGAMLQRGPGHLATGKVKYFSKSKIRGGYKRYERWLNGLADAGNHYDDIYRECVIPSPCWMVWRQDLVEGGAFERDVYPEDYDLCFRFYKEQLEVAAISEVLHLWRDHPGRASRNQDHYAEQTFSDLKISWFLKLDYQPERPLVLWGAGAKGKQLARRLVDRKIPFHWVCNTPSKWGKKIYGQPVSDFRVISRLTRPQILVGISAPRGQKEIRQYLEANGLEVRENYFLFC